MRQFPTSLLLALALTACAVPRTQTNAGLTIAAPTAATAKPTAAGKVYVPVAFADLPGWNDDQLAQALPALQLTCERFALLPPDQTLGGSGLAAQLGGKVAQWLPACQAARALTPGDTAGMRAFLEQYFTPYQLQQNGQSQALITGYYEPEVRGSRTASRLYATPLLGRPRDLVQVNLGDFDPDLAGKTIIGRISGASLEPYYSRAEIEGGVLKPQHLALVYLASPVDAFFVQIQGSARVRLPDGKIMQLAYAGKNGQPYQPIGKILADDGAIPSDQISMQSIRSWLDTHPVQAKAMMDQNASYVFFRQVTSISPNQGPPGELGVALTAGRSLAIDRSVVPLGAPMWLATTDPVDHSAIDRLTLAQDTGAAITGPLRADLFFGAGDQAAERAGLAKQSGTLYLLLPKA